MSEEDEEWDPEEASWGEAFGSALIGILIGLGSLLFFDSGFCLTFVFIDTCLIPGWLIGLVFLGIGLFSLGAAGLIVYYKVA